MTGWKCQYCGCENIELAKGEAACPKCERLRKDAQTAAETPGNYYIRVKVWSDMEDDAELMPFTHTKITIPIRADQGQLALLKKILDDEARKNGLPHEKAQLKGHITVPSPDYQYVVLYAEKDYLLTAGDSEGFDYKFEKAQESLMKRFSNMPDRCFVSVRKREKDDAIALICSDRLYPETVSQEVVTEEMTCIQRGQYPLMSRKTMKEIPLVTAIVDSVIGRRTGYWYFFQVPIEKAQQTKHILRECADKCRAPLDLEASFDGHVGVGANLTDRAYGKDKGRIDDAMMRTYERLKDEEIPFKPFAGRVHAEYKSGMETQYWTEVGIVSGKYANVQDA